ncbi:MAG: ester cyclase [Ignavibacteriales bacterium]|nr:ester cyclase [Ignavibacteriales bacterium]
MSAEINLKVARELYDAFNKKDFSQSQKLIASSAQFRVVPYNMESSGVEGYLQIVQGWANAFPDGYCDVQNIYAGEDWAVCEFIGKGAHTGPLMSPSGQIMPTGKKVEVPFCEVMKIKDGKVVSLNSYFDSATMMHQLGILDEVKHH